MIPDSLRPILFLAAGLLVGFLVAWGLFERLSTKSGGGSGLQTATSSVSSAPDTRGRPPFQARPSPGTAEENVGTEDNPSAMVSASPSAIAQQNGLPPGLTEDALKYNKELYQKYPGLKPPQINADGRDLAPEATQQLQAPPTLLASPTPGPAVSVSPLPLVLPNRPSFQSASPLPKP
jgi:hypothetical protein